MSNAFEDNDFVDGLKTLGRGLKTIGRSTKRGLKKGLRRKKRTKIVREEKE